ncbi:hypothetical protein BV22DRAFT_66416 [Leucogyrophana mollusca]|uniref:Uncharacterized protein n=1 Tax=Leucogyrophana mollusca TaxID=85980 RepID=A0ACB8BXV5_9AGAM|nr:hypothetical protein BV22DRAFT_66416 [Leucogyrophana mollusca]
MHRSLLIAEIQLSIFDQVFNVDRRPDRKTLAALARTCRAFTETALDVQWRHLDFFVRVIQCLPRDLWNLDAGSDGNISVLTFQRTMIPSDWAVFQKYARRVRFVMGPGAVTHSNPGRAISIDGQVFIALCSAPAPIPLLPNLTSLNWNLRARGHIHILWRLISPSLTSLMLCVQASTLTSPRDLSLLALLGHVCPSLKEFHVVGAGDARGVVHALTWSVCRMQNLTAITNHHLGSEAILHLARLPSLTHLTISIPPNFNPISTVLHLRKPAFSSLRELNVCSDTLVRTTAFLKLIDVAPEVVVARANSASGAVVVADLFATLASSCSPNAVHNVRISDITYPSIEVDPQDYTIGLQELRPLLRFAKLRHLHLDTECSFALDDTTLLEMAKAWPNIVVLSLNRYARWDIAAQVTPLGFLTLLQRCPNLAELSIAIDFSSIDSELPLDRPRSGFSTKTLEELHLGNSRVEYPIAIAAFLADILPSSVWVTTIWGSENFVDEPFAQLREQRWEVVKKLLKEFAAAREQELQRDENSMVVD